MSDSTPMPRTLADPVRRQIPQDPRDGGISVGGISVGGIAVPARISSPSISRLLAARNRDAEVEP